ncbi:MAG: enoyl-CoA hydratase/isomerase family protein [Microbacteriaceae bacterium]
MTWNSEPAILFTVDNGLAHVTLNRASQLNAIGHEGATLWRTIASEIVARDDIGAVLFDARGRAFCAGGDVASISQASGSVVTDLADTIHEGHLMLATCTKPIVAAVRGSVVGGGLGFMLVADYIVASDTTIFASKYADIGLTPDCGVSTLLPEAIGMRRALQLTLSGRVLNAAEALDWGLITESVPDGELDSRALAVAQAWLHGATSAFGQAKRLLRAGAASEYATRLADEARTIGAAADTADAQVRMKAFLAPRPPRN